LGFDLDCGDVEIIMHSVMRSVLIAAIAFSAPTKGQDLYRLDPVHTQILFFVSHLGFSNSQGEFLKFNGEFVFDEKRFRDTRVMVTIDTDSLDMDDQKWNARLKGRKYFDVENYPKIRFISTRIEPTGPQSANVHGQLTMLGVTRPVVLNMRFNRAGNHPLSRRYIAGFSGHSVLRRSEFGMTSDLKWVGDEVHIRLEVEGVLEQKVDASQQ
jgi:polyisoprenoid-binding protein YceI